MGKRIGVGLLSLALCVGCASSGGARLAGRAQSSVFIEKGIPRENINIRRVAIVPNRLPANLIAPEKWRSFNFNLVRQEFSSRGFEVVDYQTTIQAFERSGLPVEDTKSSREKFAEFSRELGVDAVVVPYYGTFAWSTTQWMVVNTSNFAGVASFQVYLAQNNDFLARIDATAVESYTTGWVTLAGVATTLFASFMLGPSVTGSGINTSVQSNPAQTPVMVLGGGLSLVDLLMGSIAAAKAPDGYWEAAFRRAVKDGLGPFFQVIRAGTGNAQPAVAPQQGYSPSRPAYPPPQQGYPPPQQGYPPPQQGYPPPQQGYPPPQQPQRPPSGLDGIAPPQPAGPGTSPALPMPGGCSSNADCRPGFQCVQSQCVPVGG